jgi:hypothetical protein
MKKQIAILTFAACASLADSTVANLPVLAVAQPNKSILAIEWTTKEYYQMRYHGNVKVGATTHTDTNIESKPVTKNYTGLYYTTPWIDRFRYSFAIHPLIAEGVATAWDNPLAMASAKKYEVSYTSYMASACTKASDNIALSATLNMTQMKAEQDLYRAGVYNIKMDGEDVAPSVTLSALWKLNNALYMVGGWSSETKFHLKGSTSGSLGARNASAVTSLDTLRPAETQLSIDHVLPWL